MDRPTTIPLRIGDWRLDSQAGQLSRGSDVQRLEARTLRLLMYLANRSGETVSIDELLDNVWSGVVVTQDSVYQAITALRRLLGDDAKEPAYIVTVPRLGYRLIARVAPWDEVPAVEPAPALDAAPMRTRWHARRLAPVMVGFAVVVAVFGWRALSAPGPRSVAVLPFLDLTTQQMNEEYFADGMTEEIVHRLSKLPGFEVPAPTASFHYKGTDLPPAAIARELGVTYLLDGSLREADGTMRVSARLMRARDGVVLWAETYDRPKSEGLSIQDEIASDVARALEQTIR